MLRYLLNVARLWESKARGRVHTEVLRARAPGLLIGRQTTVRYDDLSALSIGTDVSIGAFGEIIVIARSPHSSVAGRFSVGANTVIGSYANIRAAGGEVRIGDNCLLAQFITIVAANHLDFDEGASSGGSRYDEVRTGVRIGTKVWIGAGACLLPGADVGDGAVIAAGAVVTGKVPGGEIWGGVPACRLGDGVA